MYLNSSRLKRWGDTFFTTATVKMSMENWVWWASLACIDKADFSHFSSLKHPLCPLVRLWHSCVVRPKYVSDSPQSLHIHMYMTFFDLQLRCFGMWRVLPLIVTLLSLFIWGHCRQPRALQCWPFDPAKGKQICLLRTTVLPIELFFFSANIMRVSPINWRNSLSKLRTSDLNSATPSKKWMGNTKVSFSSGVALLLVVDLRMVASFSLFNVSYLYPLASKFVMHCVNSSSLVSRFELFLKVLNICENGMELNTDLGWKLLGFK